MAPTYGKGMLLEQGINGGKYKKENNLPKLTDWISVPNIDEYTFKLKRLGGKIIVEKMEIEGVGFTAIGIDPEGNQVAMLQPLMQTQ